MTGKKKILVADDSKTALMITNMALSKKPYDVATAVDGEDAITKALAGNFDLIVLDIVMPSSTASRRAAGCAVTSRPRTCRSSC